MSEVYMIPVDTQITNDQYRQLLRRVSKNKAIGVQKYMYRLDALRSLSGEAVIRHLLLQHYAMKNDEICFSKNAYGKPFIKGIPGFHFNISHAGKWVACAIDNKPVGIDIEKKDKVDLQIANRFFAEVEVKDLYKQPFSERTDYFYQLWTLKESYIKMVGEGLYIPLDSFSCRILPNCEVTFYSHGNSNDVYLKLYEIDSLHQLAICQMSATFPLNIHNLTIDEIIGAE